jgi:hypothetical protein
LDVDSSSCHATFHLKAAARQRKAEQAKWIAGAKEELSKLDRRVLALSDELKSTLGGPPRAALDAKMKQATEEVRESKRRMWLAKTLIKREDEEDEKVFLKPGESRDLPNAPWTHADQQRLMFMEATKYLTNEQCKTESLKAWAAGKDIEAMAAAQGITCKPAAPPSSRCRPSSTFQSPRGPPTDSRRLDVDRQLTVAAAPPSGWTARETRWASAAAGGLLSHQSATATPASGSPAAGAPTAARSLAAGVPAAARHLIAGAPTTARRPIAGVPAATRSPGSGPNWRLLPPSP